MKMDEKDYAALDKQYILKTKRESFGYVCLTNQKRFYMENNPRMVVEKASIDDLILVMTGEK